MHAPRSPSENWLGRPIATWDKGTFLYLRGEVGKLLAEAGIKFDRRRNSYVPYVSGNQLNRIRLRATSDSVIKQHPNLNILNFIYQTLPETKNSQVSSRLGQVVLLGNGSQVAITLTHLSLKQEVAKGEERLQVYSGITVPTSQYGPHLTLGSTPRESVSAEILQDLQTIIQQEPNTELLFERVRRPTN